MYARNPPPLPETVPQSSEKFDQYSFRKYMHDFGMAYHNQAMELIAICRLFSQVAQHVFTQDAKLTEWVSYVLVIYMYICVSDSP